MIRLIFLTIALSSCVQQADKEQCEKWSQALFRGEFYAARDFKKKCNNTEIYYTKEKCQEAFNILVEDGDKKRLQKDFGANVLGCFTEKDKNRFLRNLEN